MKAYYLAELDMLRTSERARNIHALTGIRDESGNAMARIATVKVLEQIGDDPIATSTRPTAPGILAPQMKHLKNGAELWAIVDPCPDEF